MDLMKNPEICAPVTVWHYLSEGMSGGVVYHASLYDAAVTTSLSVGREQTTHRTEAVLQGFLFPSDDAGDGAVLPLAGADLIAPGDWQAWETPAAARAAGAQVYRMDTVSCPPRLSCGTLVDWVLFEAKRVV
ncbi:MAG: hypothetical protein IJW77_16130 [Clostridia bacterium]|nr:hypothetical protein [Clostridia bacterium]